MIIKYEKLENEEFKDEPDKDKATHKHKCYHDEKPFRPCIREKLK